MTVRAGIVGCGFIGVLHGLALHGIGRAGLADVTVTAALDRDEERAAEFAAEHQAASVADSLEGLLSAVDLVVVATWTSEHLRIVEQAAERGVAVMCEKPLGMNLEQAGQIAEQLRRVRHQVDLPLRHTPAVAALRDALTDGRWGAPLMVRAHTDQFWPISGHYASTWRADPDLSGGGTLLEHSIHDVDLVTHLFGSVEAVSCVTRNHAGHGAQLEDVASVQLEFAEGGLVGSLTSVWHHIDDRSSSHRLQLICDEAILTVEDLHGPVVAVHDGGTETLEPPVEPWRAALLAAGQFPTLQSGPDLMLLEHLAGGDTPGWRPDADVALAAHRVVDACYRSAADGGVPRQL